VDILLPLIRALGMAGRPTESRSPATVFSLTPPARLFLIPRYLGDLRIGLPVSRTSRAAASRRCPSGQ
jgi:hypothetical protein